MRSKTRASRRTAQAADVLQVGVEPSSSDCAIAIQDLPIPCFRIVSGTQRAFIGYRVLKRSSEMGVEVGGLLGLIILVLDVWALIRVVGSGASTGTKVLWVVVILLLPLIGLLLWWLIGPK
jgi:hypothetical protein